LCTYADPYSIFHNLQLTFTHGPTGRVARYAGRQNLPYFIRPMATMQLTHSYSVLHSMKNSVILAANILAAWLNRQPTAMHIIYYIIRYKM